MSQPAKYPTAAISTSELHATLTSMIGRIARLDHRPSACQSSYALNEIDIILEDGTFVPTLLKDLSRQALLEDARQVKPAFLHNPLREIEVYRSLLAPHRLGTAHCHGIDINTKEDRYWIFIERVSGQELYQVGAFSVWQTVARWLALFHCRFAAEAGQLPEMAHLLKCDGDYYHLWCQRALAFLPVEHRARSEFKRLAQRYDRVVDRLLALPATLVHGEFYASNVLVQETADGLRVCPVDWEMAAVGPGLIDLAALTSGTWTEAQQNDLAMAYHAAWAGQGTGVPDEATFLSALDHCRLHLAVQWLGWAPDWSPPPEQRQDWLGEALRLADRIGL